MRQTIAGFITLLLLIPGAIAQHGSHGGHGTTGSHGSTDSDLSSFRKALALQADPRQQKLFTACEGELKRVQTVLAKGMAADGSDEMKVSVAGAVSALIQQHEQTQRSFAPEQRQELKRLLKRLDSISKQMAKDVLRLDGQPDTRKKVLVKLDRAAAEWHAHHAQMAKLMGVPPQ